MKESSCTLLLFPVYFGSFVAFLATQIPGGISSQNFSAHFYLGHTPLSQAGGLFIPEAGGGGGGGGRVKMRLRTARKSEEGAR